MITDAIKRLVYLCDTLPPLLTVIDETAFNEKGSPEKWSKKEILGHLIDSATNNHQRFVRVQFEDRPTIAYDQNQWNRHSFYQQMDKQHLIDFWALYNKHLLEILKRVPAKNLQRECMVDGKLLTLTFLINDYVAHLEHHLKQLVSYDDAPIL